MTQSAFPFPSPDLPPRPRVGDAARDPAAGTVYDALADLFLGNAAAATPAPVTATRSVGSSGPNGSHVLTPPRRARIEGVILGNVPVLSSAWVSQYARFVARETDGPVAVLRTRNTHVTLDVVGDRTDSAARRRDGREPGANESLPGALATAGASASAWVVSSDREAVLADLLDEGLLDGLTVLTGTDEAAVVACYRILKSLVLRNDASGIPIPARAGAITVTIVGADAPSAHDARTRLERAVQTFLGRPTGVMLCVGPIVGGPARTLFQGEDGRPVDELVDLVRSMGERATLPSRRPADRAEMPPARDHAALPDSSPDPLSDLAMVGDDAASDDEVPSVEPALGRAGSPTGVFPLVAHLPDLSGLSARCPYAGGVELATDADGQLHLLCWASPEVSGALTALVTAQSWAMLHARVLSAACPALKGSANPRPALHVLTEDPKGVRGLLDTEIRVHLLIRVPTAGMWVSKVLN